MEKNVNSLLSSLLTWLAPFLSAIKGEEEGLLHGRGGWAATELLSPALSSGPQGYMCKGGQRLHHKVAGLVTPSRDPGHSMWKDLKDLARH